MKRRKITANFKKQVIYDILNSGLTLSKISAKYKIAKTTIYKWKKLYLSDNTSMNLEPGASDNNLAPNGPIFSEVLLKDEINSKPKNIPSGLTLKKASLEFNSLNLSLDGNISPTILLRVVSVLEEETC